MCKNWELRGTCKFGDKVELLLKATMVYLSPSSAALLMVERNLRLKY